MPTNPIDGAVDAVRGVRVDPAVLRSIAARWTECADRLEDAAIRSRATRAVTPDVLGVDLRPHAAAVVETYGRLDGRTARWIRGVREDAAALLRAADAFTASDGAAANVVGTGSLDPGMGR